MDSNIGIIPDGNVYLIIIYQHDEKTGFDIASRLLPIKNGQGVSARLSNPVSIKRLQESLKIVKDTLCKQYAGKMKKDLPTIRK